MIYKNTLKKLVINNVVKAIYIPDQPLELETAQLYADAVSVSFNIVVNDVEDDLKERTLAYNLKEVSNIFKIVDNNILKFDFKIEKEVNVGDEILLLFETSSSIDSTMNVELEGYFDFNIAALSVGSKYNKYIVKAVVEVINANTNNISLTFTATEETSHISVRNLVILKGGMDILHVDTTRHDTLLLGLPEIVRMEADLILVPGLYCTENVFMYNVSSKMPYPIKVQKKSRSDSPIYTSNLLPGDTAVITDTSYLLRGSELLEANTVFRSADIYYLEDIVQYKEATIRLEFKGSSKAALPLYLLSKSVDNNIILNKNFLFIDGNGCVQCFNGNQRTLNNFPIDETANEVVILTYSSDLKELVLKVGSTSFQLPYIDNAFGITKPNLLPHGSDFSDSPEKGTHVSNTLSCKEVIQPVLISYLQSLMQLTYNEDNEVWVMKYVDNYNPIKNFTDYTFSFYVTIDKNPEIGVDFDIVTFGSVNNENITVIPVELVPNTYKVVSVTNSRNSTVNRTGIKRTPMQSNLTIKVGGFKLEEGNQCTSFIDSNIDNPIERIYIGGGEGMESLDIISLSIIPRYLTGAELNEL